jgi:phage terminase large subunit
VTAATQVHIPKAFAGLFQPHRYKAFFGGRGSAKSHSFAAALVLMAAQKPMRIVCAREIQNSLRESVKQLIEDKIKAFGLEHMAELLDKETRLGPSKFIYIGMWRNPEAAKSLEGADVFWGEEASAFSERSLRIIRPTMRKPGSELWFSWNPEFEHDPVDKLFRGEQGAPENSLVQEVSWRDNPWFSGSPLAAEKEYDYRTDPAKAEHVWGGGYVTAVDGAYYAQQLAQAREEGRIGTVAADPLIRKRAIWDLGVADSMSIWIEQWVDRQILVLDYIEGQGQSLGYYTTELRARGHGDALCILPHDGAHRDNVTATRFEDHLQSAGFETQVVPNQGKGAAMQRIEATRRLFPIMWFNEETTRPGLKALAAYHERRDENRNVGLGPEHDWASHAADAKGLGAVAYEQPKPGNRAPLKRNVRGLV